MALMGNDDVLFKSNPNSAKSGRDRGVFWIKIQTWFNGENVTNF